MNQRKNKNLVAISLATFALWSCTGATGPGGAAGGSGNAAGSGAGSSAITAGSGSVAGGPTGGAAGGLGVAGHVGGASGGLGGSAAGASTAGASTAGGAAGGMSQAGSAGAAAANAGAAGSAPVACPTSVTIKAGDNNKTLTIGSVQRTYLVHAPPNYTGKTAVPVVFDFHGLSGNGSQQKSLSRWDKLADSEGFIMVYPDGIDKAWNAGLCCTNDKTIDDVGFVRKIISALQADACIDAKRIYATGCSNGGGMSYKLACEAADVIAGVAPVDFDCVAGSACAMCKPSRPITEVQFRGTSDQLVDYAGAGAFMGAKKNYALWGGLNGCTGTSGALSGNSACESYPMCGGGTETVLCTVQSGTHCGSYSSFMIPQVAWGVLKNEVLP
ncbi:MAG TPA: PHB depolymerase family esterase [Polyangiaceae bacterium]|nr:PHB depolymerase family esterase [Polyangiaceae bacterium]